MERPLRTFILAVLAIGAMLVFATDLVRLWPRAAHAQSQQASTGPSLYQMQLLTEGREQLPRTMDEVTVLESFDFDGATLVYGYAVSAALRPDADVAAFKAGSVASSCSVLDRSYRPGELESLRHRYVFADGQMVEIEVSRIDCDRAAAEGTGPGTGNFLTQFEAETGIDVTP